MNGPPPPLKQDPLWLRPLLGYAQCAAPEAKLKVVFGEDYWPGVDLWAPEPDQLRRVRKDMAEWSMYTAGKNNLSAIQIAQTFRPLTGLFQSNMRIECLSYKYDMADLSYKPHAFGFYDSMLPATRGLIYLPYRQMPYTTLFERAWGVDPLWCSAEARCDIMPAVAWHELGHYLHKTAPFTAPVCPRLDEIMADRQVKIGNAFVGDDLFSLHLAWRRLNCLKSDVSGAARSYWSWQSVEADGDPHLDFLTHRQELKAVWELKARAAHLVVGTPFNSLASSLANLGRGQGLAAFYNTLTPVHKVGLLKALPTLVEADTFSLADTRTLTHVTLQAVQRFVPGVLGPASS